VLLVGVSYYFPFVWWPTFVWQESIKAVRANAGAWVLAVSPRVALNHVNFQLIYPWLMLLMHTPYTCMLNFSLIAHVVTLHEAVCYSYNYNVCDFTGAL